MGNEIRRDNTGTRRSLEDAGLKPGMKVLELGCGTGEVTELAAELVGPQGFIAAVDRNEAALTKCRDVFSSKGLANVKFMQADLNSELGDAELGNLGSFDALIGRRVLMYLANSVEVLSELAKFLKPGGLVFFEEPGFTFSPRCTDSMPAHDKAMDWLRQMLDFEGASADIGFSLPALYIQAGYRPSSIRAEAVILGQGSQYPLSVGLEMMQSRVLKAGIADQAEIDSMIRQLKLEGEETSKVFIMNLSFCAWAVKP